MKNTIIGFYGDSNSGKTTLIVEIIKKLTKDGLSVVAIKQSDKKINVDTQGKDTWRYREAGASLIVLLSEKNTDVFINKKLDVKKIDEIISNYGSFDVILIEGAKDSHIPKIKIGNGVIRDNTIAEYKNDFDQIIKKIKNEIEKRKLKQKITLEVNGINIPLSEFPADMIKNTLIGMVSSLKGVKKINNLKIIMNLL